MVKKNKKIIVGVVIALIIISTIAIFQLPFSFTEIINPDKTEIIELDGLSYTATIHTETGTGSRTGNAEGFIDINIIGARGTSSLNAGADGWIELIQEKDVSNVDEINFDFEGSLEISQEHFEDKSFVNFQIFIVDSEKEQLLLTIADKNVGINRPLSRAGTFSDIQIKRIDNSYSATLTSKEGDIAYNKVTVNDVNIDDTVKLKLRFEAFSDRLKANTEKIEISLSSVEFKEQIEEEVEEVDPIIEEQPVIEEEVTVQPSDVQDSSIVLDLRPEISEEEVVEEKNIFEKFIDWLRGLFK